MLLHPNNIAFGKAFPHPTREVFSLVTGMVLEVSWTAGSTYLTSIHNFSAIILRKKNYAKEVPSFHLIGVIHLRINMLGMVKLRVELHVIPPIIPP